MGADNRPWAADRVVHFVGGPFDGGRARYPGSTVDVGDVLTGAGARYQVRRDPGPRWVAVVLDSPARKGPR